MAGGDELKLLGLWTSPYVIRVRIVLHLKGMTYEYVEEDISDKSELLSSNPVYKKVPVLIHDGKPICESSVIVQYIDEIFVGTGASVLPADTYKRATARFWAAYIDDKMGPAWRTILFTPEAKKEEAAAQMIAALEILEGAFKDCSDGSAKFFGGDNIGFVDAVLGGYFAWFKAIEKMIGIRVLDADRTSLLAAWGERFAMAGPAKGLLLDDVDEVLEFLQKFL